MASVPAEFVRAERTCEAEAGQHEKIMYLRRVTGRFTAGRRKDGSNGTREHGSDRKPLIGRVSLKTARVSRGISTHALVGTREKTGPSVLEVPGEEARVPEATAEVVSVEEARVAEATGEAASAEAARCEAVLEEEGPPGEAVQEACPADLEEAQEEPCLVAVPEEEDDRLLSS